MTDTERCLKYAWLNPLAGRKPRDRFEHIAEAIISDLRDRHTIKWGFDNLDQEVSEEIVEALAAIVKEVYREELPHPEDWK
jgi:ribosomal protein S12 methylthiotransferase accessory factor YcaO